jgi:hypothetical protein
MFAIANTRLAMAIVPAMGRSHFFAVYSVAHSLVGGVFPIVWGLLLDTSAAWEWITPVGDINRFSVLYVGAAGLMLFALGALQVVDEPKAITTEEFLRELLVESPARAITRIWQRPRVP